MPALFSPVTVPERRKGEPMANTRKYGYVKPIKRNVNPIRWVPKGKPRNRERNKGG